MKELELSVNYFSESLIQNSIDGIVGFDLNNIYIIWNPAMEKMSGKKKEEVLGKLAWETFPFLSKIGEPERMARVIKGESFRVDDLEYNVPETNSRGYYDAQYFPLVDKSGNVIGGMKVIHETSKRKKIEDQLKLKNEQLLEAQDIAVMGNWIFDIDTRVSEWSEEVYKLFGLPRIEGQSTFEILEKHVFPEDYQNIQELAGRAITEGIPYQSQYRIKRADGAFRVIATRARPEFDHLGKVIKLKGVCQDITERWEVMEKIKENDLLIQQITEASPNFVFVYDLIQHKTDYVNKKIPEAMGYTQEEFEDENFRILSVHPDDISKMEDRDRKLALAKDSDVLELEYRVKDKSGIWHWLFSKVTVFKRTPEGKVWKILGIALDVTERKQAEKKLNESQLFISKITQALPNILYVYDLVEKKTVYTNEKEEELLGYPSAEINGLHGLMDTMLHPDDKTNVEEHFRKLINSKDGESVITEYRIKNSKGDYRWFKSNDIVFKRNEDGIPIQIVGSAQEITLRKIAEAELRYLNSQLEQRVAERTQELSKKNEELMRINSDLDNFIYTASHDLKSPISNIEGLVFTLKEEMKAYDNYEINLMLDMIQDSIQRFTTTIKELTEITKIQKDIGENEPEEIRFMDVFNDVHYSLHGLIKECCPIIDIDFSVDSINFSKKYLRSIIYNLVSNGIKYRHPERVCEVKIKTKQMDGYVILSVKDNGLGIREDQKYKIFSMFKRLHDHVEGTGVGLYIVKRIIDNAGGKIEVDSVEGEGAEFRLYFKVD